MGRLGLGEGSHRVIILKEQRDPRVTEFRRKECLKVLAARWAYCLGVR